MEEIDLHEKFDVLIIGAGSVGLLCANLLGQRGYKVLVIERLLEAVTWSRAIGITPPSLDILATVGLDDDLIRHGVPISQVSVHGNNGLDKRIGLLSFAGIPSKYPYILSVPQTLTEHVLAEGARRFPQVKILRGWELLALEQNDTCVTMQIRALYGPRSTAIKNCNAETATYTAPILLGCDGSKSSVRELLGIKLQGYQYKNANFLMGDFPRQDSYGGERTINHDAHLFFTRTGSVECFPLPNGMQRWIVLYPHGLDGIQISICKTIVQLVRERTGLELDSAACQFESSFITQRRVAQAWHKGNVFLLADAAHLMSPIGGQGMNTGFADCAELLPLLEKKLDGEDVLEQATQWERARRKAFALAADRAASGMKLGIIRGCLSYFRDRILYRKLKYQHDALAINYAMLDIPKFHSPIHSPKGYN